MFVLICPRCGHHERTSVIRCSGLSGSGCGEDLSSVRATEVPDTPPMTPSPLLETAPHPRQPDNGEKTPQAASGTRAREDMPRPSGERLPASDTQECRCRFKRPRNEGGIVICMACGGIVRESSPSTAAPGESSSHVANRGQQSHSRPQPLERRTTAGMSVTLPWGEEVRFSGRLVVGRAAHPDPSFPSLPESARTRLQREYGAVSRFHVLLTVDETSVTIEDLGAMNGSFVGGAAIRSGGSIRIEPPCELRLGASCSLTIRRIQAEH